MQKPMLIKPKLVSQILGITQFQVICLLRQGKIKGLINDIHKRNYYYINVKSLEEQFHFKLEDYVNLDN